MNKRISLKGYPRSGQLLDEVRKNYVAKIQLDNTNINFNVEVGNVVLRCKNPKVIEKLIIIQL